LIGYPAEPEQAHLLLKSNPSFARVCGFAAKEKDKRLAIPLPPSTVSEKAGTI